MSTQYLSYGIVTGRTHSDQEIAHLRSVKLARTDSPRWRRTRRLFTR
ncbi:MAG: hypothetical protein ACXWDL_09755 [Nocardioides sp.]